MQAASPSGAGGPRAVAAGQPALAIVGATASGKSAVAMAIARQLGGVELVSVDSMQVYRGMDIGTAKPSPAERAEIAHHGLDLFEPADEVTFVAYRAQLHDALAGIEQRGHTPVLVGGTGLYLRAVIDGLEPPGTWPALRAELEAAAAADAPALHQRLAVLDPPAAAKMTPTNARRIVRALEVTIGSGRPFSSFGPGLDQYPPSPVLQVGLRWARPALAQRIEQRINDQMAAGWLAEVAALAARPGGLGRTASQALGYRELLAHLAGACSLDEAQAQIVARTRRFAIRQDRWFRRDPRIRWIDVEQNPLDAVGAVLEAWCPWPAR